MMRVVQQGVYKTGNQAIYRLRALQQFSFLCVKFEQVVSKKFGFSYVHAVEKFNLLYILNFS